MMSTRNRRTRAHVYDATDTFSSFAVAAADGFGGVGGGRSSFRLAADTAIGAAILV